MQIPDITKLTWSLNVALAGAIFSVFALIYNPYYIYYGFFTVLYGILGHLIDLSYGNWLEKKGLGAWFVFASQLILTGIWVILLLIIYK